jgi:hypothetical protein
VRPHVAVSFRCAAVQRHRLLRRAVYSDALAAIIGSRGGRLIKHFATWIADTPLSHLIEDVSWIVPLFQTIHILCIAIVLSSIAMLDLRLMGVAGKRVTISGMASRFLRPIWWSLVVLAITGITLIIGEPERSLPNIAFQLKMALLASAIIVTLVFQHTVRKNAEFWDLSPARRGQARLTATISLALWIGIAVCGRLIAYVGMDDA